MNTPARTNLIELAPVYEPEEAVFSISYDHSSNLVIDWNDYREPEDAIAEAKPDLERSRRSQLLSSFAQKSVLYEGAYVILGGPGVLPGGTIVDIAGGGALAAVAAYRAKKSADATYDAAIAQIAPRRSVKEFDPNRKITIPELSLVLTAENDSALPTEDEAEKQGLSELDLVRMLDERYPESDMITYVDEELYNSANTRLSENRQERMQIYVRRLRKNQKKPYSSEDVTEERYKKAKRKLEHYDSIWSDFSKKDTKRLRELKSANAELKQFTKQPPIDDQPTWYVDVQKVVATFATWLNDRNASTDALMDIYEISLQGQAIMNGDETARINLREALQRLMTRAVYTT